jgi:DNA-binding MarR family transcriptional regulator
MVVPLGRLLIEMEQPILRAHDVSMWGYVVLNALHRRPRRTQAALALAIGADKTRIIGTLDDLQARGLIQRQPDPADRRARLLALTEDGQRVRRSIQAAIRRREAQILARLPDADRAAFLRSLQALASPASREGAD